MNIKTKILIPSLVSAALLLVVGISSYSGMHSISIAMNDINRKGLAHIDMLNDARDELMMANMGAYRLLAIIGSASESRQKQATAEVLDHADRGIRGLQEMLGRDDVENEEKASLTEIIEPLAKYRKNLAQAMDLGSDDPSAAAGMVLAADKRFAAVEKKLDAFVDEQKKEADDMAAVGDATASRAMTTQAVVILIGLITAIVIALLMAGRIVAPLLDAKRVAEAIADGNLANRIDVRSDDETGELLKALQRMQDGLRELIGRIAENARQTGATSGEMTDSLTQIDRAVAKQNDATSAVAAAVEQMSVSINNIRDNARQALSANQSAARMADEGVVAIEEAFDEMMRISSAVKEAAGVVEQVGQQSNDISSIVSVIREVADQTNLLALNAAIEAARAGEAGRGFAVVADEVRKLAEKTTSSAAQITQMIDAIQRSAGQAVSNIQHVVDEVQETATHAGGARSSIERIQTSVQQSEMHAREIDGALNEQSQASHLIAQQVEEITRMSDTNAQSVEGAGRSMRELNEQSRSLQGAVARFSI